MGNYSFFYLFLFAARSLSGRPGGFKFQICFYRITICHFRPVLLLLAFSAFVYCAARLCVTTTTKLELCAKSTSFSSMGYYSFTFRPPPRFIIIFSRFHSFLFDVAFLCTSILPRRKFMKYLFAYRLSQMICTRMARNSLHSQKKPRNILPATFSPFCHYVRYSLALCSAKRDNAFK